RPADDDDVKDYRNAIPRGETVEMKVPAATTTGQALTVETHRQAVKGDTATFYQLTRGVSGVVKGAGVWVLALVKTVVSFPPTSVTADSAIWGPWPGDALDPLVYRVTVTRVSSDQYSYKFDAHGKLMPNAEFVTILSGTHKPALDGNGHPVEGFGQ